jgi:hypothetical protein
MTIKGAKMLTTCMLTKEVVLGNRRKLISVGSRAANQIPQVLPVLLRSHPLGNYYIEKAHKKGHEGSLTTNHRSRKEVWVIGGKIQADTIHWQCNE